MKDEIISRAIEAYIEKLECENAQAKQVLSEISKITGFDGSRPNRTGEDKYHEIVDILQWYSRDNDSLLKGE